MLKRLSFLVALVLSTLHHPHDLSSGAHLALRRGKVKAHHIHLSRGLVKG